MIILMALLTVLTVIFFYFNRNNKTGIIISISLLSIVMMGVIGTIYLSKTIAYTYAFSLDYKVYLILLKVRLTISQISLLFSISKALFFSSVFMLYINISRHKIASSTLLILGVALYLIVNNPAFCRSMEIRSALAQKNAVLDLLYNYRIWISILIPLVFSIIPLPVYFIKAVSSKARLGPKYYLLISVCILILDLFVYVAFSLGILSNLTSYNIGMARLPIASKPIVGYYATMFIMVPLFVTIIFIAWYYKPFVFLNIVRRQRISSIDKKSNENMSVIFHEIKNNYIATGLQFQLAEKAINKGETEKCLNNIKKGQRLVNKYLDNLNETLLYLSNQKSMMGPVDVVGCINELVATTFADNIIDFKSSYDSVEIFGNKRDITESFRNIIINSLDALKLSEEKSPKITIEILKMDNYCIIEISDNGVGIERKNLKRIFKPFFSLKNDKNRSGIGLAYVQRVISAHNGVVSVKSKKGAWTRVQIVLPIYKTKRNLL